MEGEGKKGGERREITESKRMATEGFKRCEQ